MTTATYLTNHSHIHTCRRHYSHYYLYIPKIITSSNMLSTEIRNKSPDVGCLGLLKMLWREVNVRKGNWTSANHYCLSNKLLTQLEKYGGTSAVQSSVHFCCIWLYFIFLWHNSLWWVELGKPQKICMDFDCRVLFHFTVLYLFLGAAVAFLYWMPQHQSQRVKLLQWRLRQLPEKC